MSLAVANVAGIIRALEEEGIPRAEIADEVQVSPAALDELVAGSYSEGLERAIISFCERRGRLRLLQEHGVIVPAFDRRVPFEFNQEPAGYGWHDPLAPLPTLRKRLLDFEVDFPFGVPACILTYNYQAIGMFASLGFDVLTYKTVRTQPFSGHPHPNWAYATKVPDHFVPDSTVQVVAEINAVPDTLEQASMVNSFGIPSMETEAWQEDIAKAKRVIRRGHQVLIVSVVASSDISPTSQPDEIAQDFVRAGEMAKEAGADMIELNFSCPNTPDSPEIYRDPKMSAKISKAMFEALQPTPILMKIGYLRRPLLDDVLKANQNWIQGIVAINTVSANVIDPRGEPLFGPDRATAGVSGAAIRNLAVEVARNLVEFKERAAWGDDKIIVSMGGVTKPNHVGTYLELGVDAVMSCTGAYSNRFLAVDTRRLLGVSTNSGVTSSSSTV